MGFIWLLSSFHKRGNEAQTLTKVIQLVNVSAETETQAVWLHNLHAKPYFAISSIILQ